MSEVSKPFVQQAKYFILNLHCNINFNVCTCTLVQSKHGVSISRILRLCCLILLSHFSVKRGVETVKGIKRNAVLMANLDRSNINKNMYEPSFLK